MAPETEGHPASDASERVDVMSSPETSTYTLTVAEAAALMARSEGTVRHLIRDEDQALVDASGGQESAQALVQHPALQALIMATVEQATAPLVAQFAGKDATIERQAEELGAARERARQAEELAAQIERTVRRQQRPWWLRLLS